MKENGRMYRSSTTETKVFFLTLANNMYLVIVRKRLPENPNAGPCFIIFIPGIGQIPKSLVDSVTAKAPRWVEMWSGVDGFRLDSFFSRNQKLTVFGCDTSTGPHDSLHAALFNFFSKDSTFAIDVFSGSYIAKMYNNRILAKKLPTTEIKIVDSRADELVPDDAFQYRIVV